MLLIISDIMDEFSTFEISTMLSSREFDKRSVDAWKLVIKSGAILDRVNSIDSIILYMVSYTIHY